MAEQNEKAENVITDAEREDFEKVVANSDRCDYPGCSCSGFKGTDGWCDSCGHSWQDHK